MWKRQTDRQTYYRQTDRKKKRMADLPNVCSGCSNKMEVLFSEEKKPALSFVVGGCSGVTNKHTSSMAASKQVTAHAIKISAVLLCIDVCIYEV